MRAICWQHCSDDNHKTRPLLLVTASVDKISLKKPLSVEKDLMMRGAVAWVGRSSMEIRMEILQSDDGGLLFQRSNYLIKKIAGNTHICLHIVT
jgi:acyl-CoA hydrolase